MEQQGYNRAARGGFRLFGKQPQVKADGDLLIVPLLLSFHGRLSYRRGKSLPCKSCSPEEIGSKRVQHHAGMHCMFGCRECPSHLHPRKLIRANHEETGR